MGGGEGGGGGGGGGAPRHRAPVGCPGPALLLYNGTKTSKAAVLSRATATANSAMAAFMKAHYKTKLRQGRVRTSSATATSKWITQPSLFPPDVFRLCASARLGLLPVNAHRQPQTNTSTLRHCQHCHFIEIAQHTYLSVKRKTIELENNTMMGASCAVGPFSAVSTS